MAMTSVRSRGMRARGLITERRNFCVSSEWAEVQAESVPVEASRASLWIGSVICCEWKGKHVLVEEGDNVGKGHYGQWEIHDQLHVL